MILSLASTGGLRGPEARSQVQELGRREQEPWTLRTCSHQSVVTLLTVMPVTLHMSCM